MMYVLFFVLALARALWLMASLVVFAGLLVLIDRTCNRRFGLIGDARSKRLYLMGGCAACLVTVVAGWIEFALLRRYGLHFGWLLLCAGLPCILVRVAMGHTGDITDRWWQKRWPRLR